MSQPTAKVIEDFFDRLWPICRSITGDGLRKSFQILQEVIPLELTEVPSGTEVFDWAVPDEWNIKDAFIITPEGKKIADFKVNNLHVVNYSIPVDKEVSFDELNAHLHYKKELPDAVPYITSYYQKRWGFCVSFNQYNQLPREGTYKVYINSELRPGSLTYGDLLLSGESEEEILFSSYLCHPSMANNELSGPLTLAFLYREIEKIANRKYSYRFIIAPETIGTICYLRQYKDQLLNHLKAGYIFTCCGDDGPISYKRTREEESITNKMTKHQLMHSGLSHQSFPYDPIGSDERQYGSPGFNLPVGVLMRTPFSEFREYHTSADNKKLMDFEKMAELIAFSLDLVKSYELNSNYENQIKYCEPFLGNRDLYEELSTKMSHSETIKMRLRLLNYLDGTNELVDICDKYGYSILDTEAEIRQLLEHGLIK